MKKCSSIFISILISTGTLCIGLKISAQTSDYNKDLIFPDVEKGRRCMETL